MKALPLWQPWATLVVLGAKRIETRHWPAPTTIIGRRVAIHATKTPAHLHLCEQDPFQRHLDAAEAAGSPAVDPQGQLPLGAIVGTVVVARCAPMTAHGIAELEQTNPDEYAFGLYELGRFAWVLRDAEPLARPVPFRGSQGIFDVPDHLLGPAAAMQPEPAQGSLL